MEHDAMTSRPPPTRTRTGLRPPAIPADLVPRHVALVMDGNGRWAKQRGLPRTEGHKTGEAALFDVIMGAIELGIPYLSAYAFSTENWRRSPDEVRFLMGFNRDVIQAAPRPAPRDGGPGALGGPPPPAVAQRHLRAGGRRAADRAQLGPHPAVLCQLRRPGRDRRRGGRDSGGRGGRAAARRTRSTRRSLARYLDEPGIPDVDLFVRSSGEQRISNFLLWQSAYAELVFLDTLFPDFDRRHLWQACEIYASRDRRYGGARPNLVPGLAG